MVMLSLATFLRIKSLASSLTNEDGFFDEVNVLADRNAKDVTELTPFD